MVQNALDNLCPNALLLIGLVHDDIPDRGTIGEIGQNASKADQVIAIPRAQGHVRMAQHLLCILERAIFRPGRLVK